MAPFYNHLYQMSTEQQYTDRIVQEGLKASGLSAHAGTGEHPSVPSSSSGSSLVLLAHNGPSGLGEEAFNICGVDW